MNKIIKLTSENVKRLHAVEITPAGNVIVIGGKNGAGKSSVLDSIQYALGGEPDAKMPVRKGEKKAQIVVDLGDLVVKRTMTAAGGGNLTIEDADGNRKTSPQAILDKLVGRLAFDPLEFSRMKPGVQAETLRELTGLNFDALDAERQTVFNARTEVNRLVSSLEARLKTMPHHLDAPKEEQSAAAILAEQEKALKQNSDNRASRYEAARLAVAAENSHAEVLRSENSITSTQEEVNRLTDKIQTLKALKESQEATASAADKTAREAKESASKLQDKDLTSFRERIEAVEKNNSEMRENSARLKVQEDLKAASKRADEMTRKIEAFDSEKSQKTSSAKYPIDGLAFDVSGVTLNGIPFDQSSSAEQLRVSVSIGLALNPKLRVLLIRDGSLLDEESMKLLAEMAGKADAQVWMERVGKDAATSVVIEDGAVVEGELL